MTLPPRAWTGPPLPADQRPTQSQHPGRAVIRSTTATAIPAAALLPLLVEHVGREWAAIAFTALVIGNAIITRVFASPRVEQFLRSLIPFLAAAPTQPIGKHSKDPDMTTSPDLIASATAEVVAAAVAAPAEVGADTNRRTITGLIAPYGAAGTPSGSAGGRTIFANGAIALPGDLKSVKLYRDHRTADGRGTPVGWLIAAEQTDAGVLGTFKIGDGPDGDQALADAQGVRDGLSVELTDVQRTGETVTAGHLAAVALVGTPAFSAARVQTVTASATGPTQQPAAPAPQAATPPAGLVYVNPRPTELTAARVAEVLTAIAQGKTDASLQAALADITRTSQVFTEQTGWLGELWSGVDYQRTIVPLLGAKPLTHWKVQGWRWVTKPTVADYAGDKAEIPTNTPTTEKAEAEAKRIAGGHDIDRKYFDFGDTEFITSYFRAMTESYAMLSDQKAADAIVAGAFDGGSAPDLLKAVAKARFIVKRGARVNPTFVLMGDDTLQTLLDYGQFDVPAFLDQLGIKPENFQSSEIVPEGAVYVGAKNALDFYELPGSPIRVQAEDVAKGGRDAALFGYYATLQHSAAGIAKVTITPPVAG